MTETEKKAPIPVIRVRNLYKIYRVGETKVRALNGVDFEIYKGEFVAIVGTSGSGKSTLLRHLSGLITGDKSAGSHIELLGRTVQREGRLARDIRKSRAHTGYIFQQFNLVNRLSVLENVLIGALGSTPFWRTCFSWFTREQKQRALQALTRVGMVHFAHQRVSTLSGGQKTRVALGRLLLTRPDLIILDEPTQGVDVGAKAEIYTIISALAESGVGVLLISSEMTELIAMCDRICVMREGRINRILARGEFSEDTIMRYAIEEVK